MISKLTGIVDQESLYRGTGSITLDVNGVGYEVFVSEKTKAQIPQTKLSISLYIETVVREDRFQLYGFTEQLEKQLFNQLQTVQGVGMKAALALLSCFTAQDLYSLIQVGDAKQITHADGIGPKIANRIVTELQEKISKLDIAAGGTFQAPTHLNQPKEANDSEPVEPETNKYKERSDLYQDAVSALSNLGYKPTHARDALTKVMRNIDPETEVSLDELIRLGLGELAVEIA